MAMQQVLGDVATGIEFEEAILKMDDVSISHCMQKVTLANVGRALCRAPELVKRRVLGTTSARVAEMLREDMAYSMAPSMETMAQAQQEILDTISGLIGSGEIIHDKENNLIRWNSKSTKGAYFPVDMLRQGLQPTEAEPEQLNQFFWQLAMKRRARGLESLASDADAMEDKGLAALLDKAADGYDGEALRLMVEQTKEAGLSDIKTQNEAIVDAILKIQAREELSLPRSLDKELKGLLEGMGQKSKSQGILALEEDLKAVENEIFKMGIQLTVDGVEPAMVRQILENMSRTRLRKAEVWFEKVTVGLLGVAAGDNPRLMMVTLRSLD